MDLDLVRIKSAEYVKGFNLSLNELTTLRETYEHAYIEGYTAGHNIGKAEGIASVAIDKAMKYE